MRFNLLIFFISMSIGQDYFPIHLGDWWEFYNPEINNYTQYAIIDTPTILGDKYFEFDGYPYFDGFYKKDTLGNLLKYNQPSVFCCDTILKLNVDAGESWTFYWSSFEVNATYVGLVGNNKFFHLEYPFYLEYFIYLRPDWGMDFLETEGNTFIGTQAYVNGVNLDIIHDGHYIPEFSVIAYPNPFNERCQFDIGGSFESATITIYNLSGQVINRKKTMNNRVFWDGRDIYGKLASSGQYLIDISTDNNRTTSKVILLK